MRPQQTCTSKSIDHLCLRSRILIYASDGVLNDASCDGEPFLARCWPGPVIEAIKKRCVLVIKDLCHAASSARASRTEPFLIKLISILYLPTDSIFSHRSAKVIRPLLLRQLSLEKPTINPMAPPHGSLNCYISTLYDQNSQAPNTGPITRPLSQTNAAIW